MNRFLFKYKSKFNATLKKSVALGGRVPRLLACGLVVGQLIGAAYAQDWKSNTVPECKEYLSKSVCHVTITIPEIAPGPNQAKPAPTHADITLRPNVVAGVILKNASPLMTCTLAASPAVLTRDPSTSITTFISTLATLGLPAGGLVQLNVAGVEQNQVAPLPTKDPAKEAAGKIAAELEELRKVSGKTEDDYEKALDDYQTARATVLGDWKYHYADDEEFTDAATEMYADLRQAFSDPLPSPDDFKALNKSAEQIEKELQSFAKDYKDDKESLAWYTYAESELSTAKANVKILSASLPPKVQLLNDLQTLLKPAFTWLNAKSNPPGSGTFKADSNDSLAMTTIYLPMSRYAQKQVTEAITCKDAASKDPAFDIIIFTAYYEPAASWDFSAAAFLSMLPGRQLGTYTQSQPAATTTAGPSILAATTQSSHQFIPGAVFELHPGPMNFRCPWAEDWPSRAKEGTGYHPWGYVCSIGPAVGFLVNPNSGTTQAEFFEGISFGIHRLALLVGNHTGRFEEFADGYALGQSVPSGTMPATTRRWTNHPAIGISFRIPIR